MTNSTPANENDENRDGDENRNDERLLPDRPGELTAVVVERDSEPDECTIYPSDATDDDLVTKWISAEEGSYVDLETMR